MWKIYQSISSVRKMKACSVYSLEFADKPMFVVHLQEDSCGEQISEHSQQSQATLIQPSHLDEELEF